MNTIKLVLSLLPLIFISMLLSTAVHELGHISYSISHGYMFEWVVIGPFALTRENNSIRFYIEKRVKYWGGVCITRPREIDSISHEVYRGTLIAGPVASLSIGVLCVVLGSFVKSRFLFVFGIMSLACFISTAIPVGKTAWQQDVSRFLALSPHKNEGILEWLVIKTYLIYDYEKNAERISDEDINALEQSNVDKYISAALIYRIVCGSEIKNEAMVTASVAQLRRIVYEIDYHWYASHIHSKMVDILADISPDIDLLRSQKIM